MNTLEDWTRFLNQQDERVHVESHFHDKGGGRAISVSIRLIEKEDGHSISERFSRRYHEVEVTPTFRDFILCLEKAWADADLTERICFDGFIQELEIMAIDEGLYE